MRFTEKTIETNQRYYSYEDLLYFFAEYAKEKYAFISVYDAEKFMNNIYEDLTRKGYEVYFGKVTYNDLSDRKRLEYAQNKEYDKIVFTKNKKFSYQREFRLYIQDHSAHKDHIEIFGINFQPSIVKECVYLSNNYRNSIFPNHS